MSRVLVIGDLHCPADHPRYLQFCADVGRAWNCDTTLFIGDIVDWHSISFHASHPELPGPKDEYELALACVQKWYEAFPNAKVCIGNHDERVNRKALDAKVPEFMLRKYADIWKTPGWDWQFDHYIDNVYYYHGTGAGGLYPAINKAKSMGESVVSGHVHAAAGVQHQASPRHRIFGMNVGCGVDIERLEFAYGKHQARRPILAAGAVLDGMPYHAIMPCGVGEPYHRGKE